MIFFHRHHRKRISLIVPFRTDHAERERNWRWLERYWRTELPGAEVIVGTDDSVPFCKTRAVNRAARKSTGDILVILDADCYISGAAIEQAAERIREARRRGRHLWFIPYRRFYRLTEEASLRLMESRPDRPLRLADPPPDADLEASGGVSFGHWYGALIQIMPREAFEAVRGMDERFSGWGGEDISLMHAIDTIYGRHKTINGPVYHVHHPTIKGRWKFTRQWPGQQDPEMNDRLSSKYEEATGDKARMLRLINSK